MSYSMDMYGLSNTEAKALFSLVDKGYAVVVFHPDEFNGVNRDKLALAMLDYGSHYIVKARNEARAAEYLEREARDKGEQNA